MLIPSESDKGNWIVTMSPAGATAQDPVCAHCKSDEWSVYPQGIKHVLRA